MMGFTVANDRIFEIDVIADPTACAGSPVLPSGDRLNGSHHMSRSVA